MLFAVGTVEYVKGDVTIQREGEWVVAQKEMAFRSSDRFVTEKGSVARLKFDDGTLVTLGSNTNFMVDSYRYEEGQSASRAKFSIVSGAFKVITGKIAQVAPANFTLKTRTSVIGIRGTVIFGEVAKSGADRFACAKGALSVTATNGASAVLNAGEMTTVAPNAAPTKPQPIDWSLFELAGNPLVLIVAAAAIALIIGAAVAFIIIKRRAKKHTRAN
jgi:hypothetical protein